tara:strand:+ start:10926 stop:11093 length:168 start_codon:yes stop_codon:yes gene_type:complete
MNTINWFQSNRIYALLQKVPSYDMGLTPEEEADFYKFLNQYIEPDYDNPPAGAQA